MTDEEVERYDTSDEKMQRPNISFNYLIVSPALKTNSNLPDVEGGADFP
jgi:hypothetical protein